MSVTDDLKELAKIQDDFKGGNVGRYVQALATPETIPKKGTTASIDKLTVPDDEAEEITFTPTATDYQFRVDVWSRVADGKTLKGYVVSAVTELDGGIIETLTLKGGDTD